MIAWKRPPMHRKFIALILGISMSVTGFTAAPARAADNDVAKVLAGLAALAVIGVAIDRRHDRKKDRRNEVSRSSRQPIVITPDRKVHPKPLPDRFSRYDLPRDCVRTFDGFGNRKFLGQRCLRNNYQYADSLPRDCRFSVNNGHKTRKVYGAHCLSKRGYRISRH